MLILLVIGALIVALTLALLGEDARPFLSEVHTALRHLMWPCGTSGWSAAMRAKYYQANGISEKQTLWRRTSLPVSSK